MKRFLVCVILLLVVLTKSAQAQAVVNRPGVERTNKILSSLVNVDAVTKTTIQLVLQSHLETMEKIWKERNAAMAAAMQLGDKERAEARSQKAWNAAAGKFNKVHATFLGKLSSVLTAAQIEIVKDGMTENGMQAEYKRFMELLPNLNEQQKAQVKAYLQEARENAMTAETEEMRQQWFIKFRGRANNFLAAAGYDLKKATAGLEKKILSGHTPKPLNNSYR